MVYDDDDFGAERDHFTLRMGKLRFAKLKQFSEAFRRKFARTLVLKPIIQCLFYCTMPPYQIRFPVYNSGTK